MDAQQFAKDFPGKYFKISWYRGRVAIFRPSGYYEMKSLLEGNEPGTAGNIMNHEVYVQVRGQLFADLHHCKANNRGKRGMKTTNCWEIRPVTDISFAVKPIN